MGSAPATACVKGSAFVGALREAGFDFFTGVPCSLLEAPISCLEADPSYGYVAAVREDEALGLCAGAYMAGRRLPVVLMQNSGLGNCLNAIASLQRIYDIPTLIVVSWRGKKGIKDAPEHIVMGEAMPKLFESFGVPFESLDVKDPVSQLGRLARRMEETRQPFALFVEKGELVA
jgi:sulfopyruvate decarboxylase subunit alpha